MVDFATLAKALKAEEFKRVSRIPYQGRTWSGADLVVISKDDETVAQYKNHTQKNWSHAGDLVLVTQFPGKPPIF